MVPVCGAGTVPAPALLVYFGGGGPPLAGPASGCAFNVAWPDGIVGVLLALHNAFGNAKSESSGISTCGHMSF